MFLSFLILFSLSVSAPEAFALGVDCEVKMKRQVLQERAKGRSVSFSFPVLPSALGNFRFITAAEKNYLRWLRGKTSWDARRNLENSLEIRRKSLRSLPKSDAFRASLERDLRNVSRILSGEVGSLRPAGCVDGLAFREFLGVADLRSHPQEFMALIFTRGRETKMIGDFDPKARGSVVGVSASSFLRREARRLRREGWSYHAHLHNHPFNFGNPYGDIGGSLAPSEADLSLYLEEKPAFAWITNGAEVIEIKRADFQKLEVSRRD